MMNEESRKMLRKITQGMRFVGQSVRLMVGMPEYSIYLEHMKNTHPDRPGCLILSSSGNARRRGTAAKSAGVVSMPGNLQV